MKCLLRLLTLVGIFALWGEAHSYEVIIDIDIVVKTTEQKLNDLSGHAFIEKNNEKTPLDISTLQITTPADSSTNAEEWALDWIGERGHEILESHLEGLDLDLVETEIDLRKNKLRCRKRGTFSCQGELSVRLRVTRS